MKILVLGAHGMAGHVIYQYFSEAGHDVYGLTRAAADIKNNIICDARNEQKLAQIISDGKFDYIINCIGILNKDAEDNKSNAIYLNGYLPHFLADKTADTRTRIIHMSTDCVFSGKNAPYTEQSFPEGETFYDRTKAIGEIVDNRNLTFRNSIVGPDVTAGGIGLFNWFMQQSGTVSGWTKSIWSGVTTLTLAKAMNAAIKQNLTGLYHLTNGSSIDKYSLIKLFNDCFEKNLKINPTEGVNADKTLKNTRSDFDFTVPSYKDMIAEMKDWICAHKEHYPHY